MNGNMESFYRFCPQCGELTVHTGYVEHWSSCDTCRTGYYVVPSVDYYVRFSEILDSVATMSSG